MIRRGRDAGRGRIHFCTSGKARRCRCRFSGGSWKDRFSHHLIAENGMVLYDNKVKDVSGMENHAKRPEILKASKNGEGSSSRISSTIQSETYYYARKLSDGRYLRLSSKGLSIWSGFVQVLPALTGIALFVIFITFSDRPFPYQKYRRSDQRHWSGKSDGASCISGAWRFAETAWFSESKNPDADAKYERTGV